MTELLSCPFCGGDVSFHKDEECPGCHLIQCGQCRAFFDFATGADPGNDCASVDALRAAIAPMWNARAQLAAIQGGIGEVVEVVGCAAIADDGTVLDLSTVDFIMRHWQGQPGYSVNPLMTVAQHQRITAAMAAEVERLREERDSCRDMAGCMDMFRKDMIERGVVGEQCPPMFMTEGVCSFIGGIMRERDALRAELAEVKGREAVPVAIANKGDCAFWVSWTEAGKPLRGPGIKLYTTPPASPDVEGLVKALEEVRGYTDSPHVVGVINTALSTWRQAQVKP